MNRKPHRTGPRTRQTRVRAASVEGSRVAKTIDDRSFIYTCQYCRLKFAQNSLYFRHMSANHQSQQKLATYQCNECQIVFTKKAYLDLHCQTNHQMRSKSKCDGCAVTFKSRYCLRRHMKLKQTMLENACLKCQKKFMNKEGLAKHIRNKHTFAHTTFNCEYCTLKFKMKRSLVVHVNRIHKTFVIV